MQTCECCGGENMIAMVRGDTKELEITIEREDGTPYEMQGGEKLYMDVRQHDYDKLPIIRKEIVPDDEGRLTVTITPKETAELPPDTYWFDVRLWHDEDHIYTVIPASKLILCRSITDLRNIGGA